MNLIKSPCKASLHAYLAKRSSLLKESIGESCSGSGAVNTEKIIFSVLFEFCKDVSLFQHDRFVIERWDNATDIMEYLLSLIIEQCGGTPHGEEGGRSAKLCVDTLISTIADELSRGPFDYIIRVPLVSFPFIPNEKIYIANGVYFDSVVVGDDGAVLNDFRSNMINKNYNSIESGKNVACINVVSPGFVGATSHSPVVVRAVSILKQVFMLCDLLDLVVIRSLDYSVFMQPLKSVGQYVVEGFRATSRKHKIPFQIVQALTTMFMTKAEEEINRVGLLHFVNDNDSVKLMRYCIENDNECCRRIKAALEWLFEATILENSTSAIVMLCLSIESMLGEKRNTKEMLASKFAYSLGHNYEKKKQFYNQFIEFYDKRSKIVHGSETILNARELEIMNNIKHGLRLIILSELKSFNVN